ANTKDVDGSPTSKGAIEIELDDDAFKNDKGELDLGKVAAAINAQAKEKELGVNATLVRSNGVTNLILTSEETGSDHALEISGGGTHNTLTRAQDTKLYLGADETSGLELASRITTLANLLEGVTQS